MWNTLTLVLLLAATQGPGANIDPCEGAAKAAIEQCLDSCLEIAEGKLDEIMSEIQSSADHSDPWAKHFEAAALAWDKFVEMDCTAAYESAGKGTIRGVYYVSCKLSHTEYRANFLWSQYLHEGVASDVVKPEFACFEAKSAP